MKIMNKDSNTEWKTRQSTVLGKERFDLNELRGFCQRGRGRLWHEVGLKTDCTVICQKSVFGHKEQYTLSVTSLVCCNWDTTLRERPNEQTGTLRKISKTKLHQQEGQSYHLQCFCNSKHPVFMCIYSGSDSLVTKFYNNESVSKGRKHLNLLPHAEKKGQIGKNFSCNHADNCNIACFFKQAYLHVTPSNHPSDHFLCLFFLTLLYSCTNDVFDVVLNLHYS